MVNTAKIHVAIDMKYLILDFDGTLIDSFKEVLSIYNELALDLQAPVIAQQEAEALRNFSSKTLIQHLQIPIYQLPHLIYKARQSMRARILTLPPCQNIAPMLHALHQRGCVLGIASSNSKSNIVRWLKHYDLYHYFTFIHTSTSFFGKKKVIKKILHKYDLNPKETGYMGDETRDIEAAHQADILSIAVTWGFNAESILMQYTPQHIIHNPLELLKIIDG